MGAVTTEQATRAAAEARARLDAAYAQLGADGAIQFDLPPVKPPPPPPAWLKAFGEWLGDLLAPVGRFLRWLFSWMPDAPYARIILWAMIAGLVAAIGWIVYERFRHGVWRLPRWRHPATGEAVVEGEWDATGTPARAWLREADHLAEEGRFAEAVHHLLMRSIEDIGRRRPQLLKPALTSRDIARAHMIPPGPRDLFAGIAAVVERSLFGGRVVDADDWSRCRAAYADFAAGRSWALPR